jgi:hypothetical protein
MSLLTTGTHGKLTTSIGGTRGKIFNDITVPVVAKCVVNNSGAS